MIIQTVMLPACATNCYLLGDEETKQCAIVDPGDADPSILTAVQEAGLNVQCILLTHAHYDHTMGIPKLRELLPQIPVYVHPGDTDGKKPFFRIEEMGELTFLNDGDHLKIGNLEVEVLHTPGHSAGSVTFRAGDALLTGDTMFKGSMGRTDLPGGSYEEIMASLKRLAELPGDYRVFPGHDRATTLAAERAENFYVKEALSK